MTIFRSYRGGFVIVQVIVLLYYIVYAEALTIAQSPLCVMIGDDLIMRDRAQFLEWLKLQSSLI